MEYTQKGKTELDKKGNPKPVHFETKNLGIEFTDAAGTPRRISGFPSREKSEAFGRKIEELVSAVNTGETLDRKMIRWIEGLPGNRKKYFAQIGLIDESFASSRLKLEDLVKEWQNALKNDGTTDEHANRSAARALKIFNAAEFARFTDIRTERIRKTATAWKETFEETTVSNHLRAAKQFSRWMFISGRSGGRHPLKDLRVSAPEASDREPISDAHIKILIDTIQKAPVNFGISGTTRAAVYGLGIDAGLRAGEIRRLRTEDFNFTPEASTVRVTKESAKNRKEARQPLNAEIAMLCLDVVENTPGGKKPFGNLTDRTADMIRDDLEFAGIKNPDCDFHSTRTTFMSRLARANTPLPIFQKLARLSTMELAMKHYVRFNQQEKAAAVEALPSLNLKIENKTLASRLALTGGFSRCLANSSDFKEESLQPPANADRIRQTRAVASAPSIYGPVAEPADARDLKSLGQ